MMVQQDWSGPLLPAHLSQITITGLEQRVQLDVASRSENFLVDTGATYSVLTSCSRAFSCQTCTFLVATGKTITKDSPKHFFVAGMDKYFPTSFWWSLSVLLPYWEEIFPCLQNLASIAVLIEDSLKLSFGGKLTIFTRHQVKQLLNGRGHLWMSDQRILRYQAGLMENSGLTTSPCEVLNLAVLLPVPEGSLRLSLLPRNFGPLDKTLRGIVRRSSDKSWGNLVHWWKQLCLGWKKEEPDMQ